MSTWVLLWLSPLQIACAKHFALIKFKKMKHKALIEWKLRARDKCRRREDNRYADSLWKRKILRSWQRRAYQLQSKALAQLEANSYHSRRVLSGALSHWIAYRLLQQRKRMLEDLQLKWYTESKLAIAFMAFKHYSMRTQRMKHYIHHDIYSGSSTTSEDLYPIPKGELIHTHS